MHDEKSLLASYQSIYPEHPTSSSFVDDLPHTFPFLPSSIELKPGQHRLFVVFKMRYIPSTKRQVKERCTTISAWQLPKQKSALAPAHIWTNEDMDPVKPENQTWTLWTWMAYWATDTINLGTWETASGILAVGLSWREAIPIVFLPHSALSNKANTRNRC